MTTTYSEARSATRRAARPAHSKLDPTAVAVLAGISVAFAVAAAFAAARPTGIEAVDAAERMLVVPLLVIAGSRARRGAIVAASALVGATGSFLGVAFAGAALLSVGALTVTNRRSRSIGGFAGGAIYLAALHSDLEVFTFASTVVGVAACSVVCASGYRRGRRRVRRAWRWSAVGVLTLLGASVVVSGALGVGAAERLRSGASATTRAIELLQNGEIEQGGDEFSDAASDFRAARGRLHGVWSWPARLIPIVSQNLVAVDEAARIGADLTETAARTLPQLDYDELLRPDGGVDLDRLASFSGPVEESDRAIQGARRDLEPPVDWLVGPIRTARERLITRVAELSDRSSLSRSALDRLPFILGADAPRRYLVLLGNPAEARDIGGHIGNWAEITATGGTISLSTVGAPLDLVQQPGGAGLADPDSYPESLTDMRPAQFPQNWGSSPDMEITARVSAELYTARTGTPVDGVVYADPYAFAALVSLTGPLDVPGVVPPYRIAEDNAAQFLMSDQYRVFASDAEGDRAMNPLIREVFDRLTTTPLPGPSRLADLFGPLVGAGRLQFVSVNADDRPLLRRLGLSRTTSHAEGTDLIGIISRNANPSKIDAFLRRTSAVGVRWDPETGDVATTVAVTMRNEAPVTGWSSTVLGGDLGQSSGTNVSDLAVLTPHDLLRVTVDGSPAPIRSTYDGSYWRHEVRLVLPPGATQTVSFELEGIVQAGSTYRITSVGQPLAVDGRRVISVVPTRGRVVGSSRVKALGGEGEIDLAESDDVAVTVRSEPDDG